jgi:hypothetical protein
MSDGIGFFCNYFAAAVNAWMRCASTGRSQTIGIDGRIS